MAWKDLIVVQTRLTPELHAKFVELLRKTGRRQGEEIAFALIEHIERGPRFPSPEVEAQLPPREKPGPRPAETAGRTKRSRKKQ